MYERLNNRLDKLLANVTGRRCECPSEPVHVAEGDPDVVILPVIRDLPCPVCHGLRDVSYVLRIIRTSLIQNSDSIQREV
jgi:hypothetical protein